MIRSLDFLCLLFCFLDVYVDESGLSTFFYAFLLLFIPDLGKEEASYTLEVSPDLSLFFFFYFFIFWASFSSYF